MDNKPGVIAASMGTCLLVAGCYLSPARPTYQLVRPEPAPPAPGAEAVPTKPAQPPAEDQQVELVGHVVQGYIAQIDTVEQRSRRSLGNDSPALLPTPLDHRPDPAVSDGQSSGDAAEEEPSRSQDPVSTSRPADGSPAEAAEPQPATVQSGESLLEPPVLTSVTVQALPQAAAPVDEPAVGESASVNRPVAAQGPPVSLAELLRRWPAEGENASFREQFDLRVLRVIAGDFEGARQPLALTSDQQEELARCFIESLIAIRQAHDGDATATAARVLDELETLGHSLHRLGELQIPTIALCHEVTGFGQYRPVDPPRFPSGLASEFVVYCELRNFASEQRADGLYHACFEMRTVILDSAGQTVLEMRDPDIEDRCRQPRRDCFLPRLVRLPATLLPGDYVAKVTVIDRLGEKVAENRATFRVIAGL